MNKFRITYPNNKEVREYKSRTTKSSNYGGFTTSDVVKFAETYPAFNSMHYDNFSWTKHFNKPF